MKKPPELVYAAFSTCPCGARLATKDLNDKEGFWACSEILLGHVKKPEGHIASLPFSCYEIPAEEV